MTFSRPGSPPALALVVIATLLLAALDDWAADDGQWIVLQLAAILVAASYLLAQALVSRDLLERRADADLLERACGVLRVPAIAGAFLFLAVTLDPHITTIVSAPRPISYPVTRVPCAGSGLRPTVAVKDGKVCLRREPATNPASVERVNLILVSGPIAVGAKGRMFVEEVPQGLLTRARFVRLLALRPA